jgi:hypothetical protein
MARAFDPDTGEQLFNVTGVPGGTLVMGPQGQHLRYVIMNVTTSTTTPPDFALAEWNSTKLWQGTTFHPGESGNSPSLYNATGVAVSPQGVVSPISISTPPPKDYNSVVNASIFNSTDMQNRYDWNVTLPWLKTMPGVTYSSQARSWSTPVTVLAAIYGKYMICRNGSYPTISGQTQNISGVVSLVSANYTYFKVDIDPASSNFGNVVWWNTISAPMDRTITYGGLDPTVGVFCEGIKETRNFNLYSATDGHLIKTTESQAPLDYFGNPIYPYVSSQLAYGRLYSYCYGGLLYCYDLTTGQRLWTYGNGGVLGNSTDSVFQAPGYYPGFLQAVGNGVLYISVTEHTVETPIMKGAFTRAINATDGTELWSFSSYTGEFGSISYAIADGFATFFNGYDNQIYVLGRGPSATTVSAPDVASSFGTPVVIKGTVTDISSGTKQNEQAARFPNGVPAMSDASMTDWMGYVYQQKPRPTDVTGVDVTLSVLDTNGNFREIGTVTSDSAGFFSYEWTPDIPGKYTVYASFAGSKAYWPSHAETAFIVMEPPEPAPEPPAEPASAADLYFVPSVIGIVIAIAVVGAILVVLLLKKRP